MSSIEEYWERVEDATREAHLAAWDTCHKIYLAMDATEAAWFRDSDYTVVEGPADVLLTTVRAWYDQSCGLRLVSAVSHNADDPNAGFVTLIPQGADDDQYDDGDDDA